MSKRFLRNFSPCLRGIEAAGPGAGTPAERECGNVFWSRPGLLKILCRFRGLQLFPFDKLNCTMEIGSWSRDGRTEDVIPRKVDGGIACSSCTGMNGSVSSATGLESGSTFQDYRIEGIAVKRKVSWYDRYWYPYPTLQFTFVFGRAHEFYLYRLIVPQVTGSAAALTVVSKKIPI